MAPEGSPTAEGDLASTPLSHLLVYAVDRKLTGALFLKEPSGLTHVVRFAGGAVVKVRPGDEFLRLGELLVEDGVVTQEELDGTVGATGLLGEVLVLAGRLSAERLQVLVDRQFLRRMERLFELPRETTYSYYDGHVELADWGGDPASVEPLTVLWAGLRAHAQVSTKMEEVLQRMGDAPLRMHPDAALDRFGFDEQERAVVDLLVERPMPFSELTAWAILPPERLEALVYALLITRQLDGGTGGAPLGSSTTARSVAVAPTAANQLGRVRLRAEVHRFGAAAPDPPGDGERAPVVNRRRRKEPPSVAPTPDRCVEPPAEPRDDLETTATEPPLTEPPAESAQIPEPASGLRSSGPALAPLSSSGPADFAKSARLRLGEHDVGGALEACSLALEQDPANPDLLALRAWIRSLLPRADVKALLVELDEVLLRHEGHVSARFYRAMLRRRLSDDAGAASDLECVIAAAPDHEEAARELRILQARDARERGGFLARLFRRS